MANRTSCVEHPAKQALVIVREDYLAICNGDDCAAAILNYFEHWQNSKLDAFEQWQRQCEIADKTGEPRPQAPDIWIYASQEQIRFDLLYTYGERKVGDTMDWLVEVGFLSARHNPKHGWDRTKQYQFEVAFVQTAIREIADSMGAKVRNGEVQNRAIEDSKIAEAIPEITTKTPNKKSNAKPRYTDLIKAWLDAQGSKNSGAYKNVDIQASAKELYDSGITAEEMTAFTLVKKKQDFWHDKFIGFDHIANEILTWKDNHKPRPPVTYAAPVAFDPMPPALVIPAYVKEQAHD